MVYQVVATSLALRRRLETSSERAATELHNAHTCAWISNMHSIYLSIYLSINHSILFYSILFYFILFYSILFSSILSCSILSYLSFYLSNQIYIYIYIYVYMYIYLFIYIELLFLSLHHNVSGPVECFNCYSQLLLKYPLRGIKAFHDVSTKCSM